MTRSTDVFVTLDGRSTIGNRPRNAVFVSIHYNYSRGGCGKDAVRADAMDNALPATERDAALELAPQWSGQRNNDQIRTRVQCDGDHAKNQKLQNMS